MFPPPGQASTVTFRASASEGESTTIEHTGLDYGGVQLVRRNQECATTPLRGADAGQDLRISVELLVPATSQGDLQAGPYFRSRRAAPGDGILGGSSAGYWLRLHSSGALTVKCLNPAHTVAFTKPPESFDADVFHKLDAAVRGDTLEVALDGRRLTFDQGGQMTEIVKIPPNWERPAQVGFNSGSAGVAFSSEPMRPRVGGQQARRFSIESYRPLDQ